MAFNPDSYLASKSQESKSGFDPDSYLAKKTQKDDLAGAAQAGLEHFGNAASFGYMPQIQGFVSQLMPDPNKEVDEKLRKQGFTIDQKKPNYIEDRDAYIKHLEQQEQDHPVASAVGTVGGSLASGVATSGLTPINGATKLARLGQAAKAGAVVGAVSNPGDKEGETTGLQLGDRLANAGTGAGMGIAGQGVIEGLSAGAKGVTGLASSLKNKAEERAFKASGAMLKDYRSAYGQDRINSIGRYMLDNGLIKPGMTVQDIGDAAEKLAANHGKDIGNILDRLDQAGAGAPSHIDLAIEIEKQALPFKGLKTAQPTYSTLQDLAEDIRTKGVGENGTDVGASFNGAQGIKKFISDQIEKVGGWKAREPSEKNLALREAYEKVNAMIEDAADKAAPILGDESLLNSYKNSKSGYRNATDVARIAQDQALRQNANKFLSPSDYLTSMGGAMVGASTGKVQNALVGAGLGVANKVAGNYGTPIVSAALDKAGSMLGRSVLPEIGEAIAPALKASEQSRISPAAVEGIMSRPRLDPRVLPDVADQNNSSKDRNPSSLKGEALWMQNGSKKLGLSDNQVSELMKTNKGRSILIHANDLPAGSKKLQDIKKQISQGRGN